jgi:hypothetical protein
MQKNESNAKVDYAEQRERFKRYRDKDNKEVISIQEISYVPKLKRIWIEGSNFLDFHLLLQSLLHNLLHAKNGTPESELDIQAGIKIDMNAFLSSLPLVVRNNDRIHAGANDPDQNPPFYFAAHDDATELFDAVEEAMRLAVLKSDIKRLIYREKNLAAGKVLEKLWYFIYAAYKEKSLMLESLPSYAELLKAIIEMGKQYYDEVVKGESENVKACEHEINRSIQLIRFKIELIRFEKDINALKYKEYNNPNKLPRRWGEKYEIAMQNLHKLYQFFSEWPWHHDLIPFAIFEIATDHFIERAHRMQFSPEYADEIRQEIIDTIDAPESNNQKLQAKLLNKLHLRDLRDGITVLMTDLNYKWGQSLPDSPENPSLNVIKTFQNLYIFLEFHQNLIPSEVFHVITEHFYGQAMKIAGNASNKCEVAKVCRELEDFTKNAKTLLQNRDLKESQLQEKLEHVFKRAYWLLQLEEKIIELYNKIHFPENDFEKLTNEQKQLFEEQVTKLEYLYKILNNNPEISPKVFKFLVTHFNMEAGWMLIDPGRPYTDILDSMRALNKQLYGLPHDALHTFVVDVVGSFFTALVYFVFGIVGAGIGAAALAAAGGLYVDRVGKEDNCFQKYTRRKFQDKFWQEQRNKCQEPAERQAYDAAHAFEVLNGR